MQNKSTPYDKVLYKVSTGDTLSKILKLYYGDSALTFSNFTNYLDTIKRDNPKIIDVNKIYPGQLILLRVPVMSSEAGAVNSTQHYDEHMGVCNADYESDPYETLFWPVIDSWKTMPVAEQDALQALAPFYLGATLGLGGMSMTTSSIDSLFKSNIPALNEIKIKYEAYKAGRITKGQYDYARRQILNRLSSNLGPVKKALYGNKRPHEVIRINRAKNSVPTGKITQQAQRLSKMSKIASKGGIILSAVGLGVTCHQVAHANTGYKKNEIMYESLGGLGTGALYGVGLTIILASNPIGWVAALTIGAVGAGLSYGGGKAMGNLYTSLGEETDVAHFSTIDKLCTDVFIK